MSAEAVAGAVMDPELPPVTIAELGVLRAVRTDPVTGRVIVTITPTYSGCPAMDAIRADIRAALLGAGFSDVRIDTVLSPAWSSDDITPAGRAKLAAAGIAPPARQILAISRRHDGIEHPGSGERPACPRCGAADTEQLSRFGSTACKALWRCRSCAEPFEYVKAV